MKGDVNRADGDGFVHYDTNCYSLKRGVYCDGSSGNDRFYNDVDSSVQSVGMFTILSKNV